MFLYWYRVSHHLSDLGWVYFDSGYSTVCPILLGQMRFWKNWELGAGQYGWNIQIKIN